MICNGEPVLVELAEDEGDHGPAGAAFASAREPRCDVRYALIRATLTPIEGTLSGIREDPFAIHFSEPLDGVEIHVWSEGKRHASFRRQERITESTDLGDLVLAPRPATAFRVVDGAGRAGRGRSRLRRRPRLASDRRLRVRRSSILPPQTRAVIAGAPASSSSRVPLPEKLPDVSRSASSLR